MVINNFPECILINISQINLIKTYPEEKSNRIKVIVSWKNGTKDYFFGNEEDINKILVEFIYAEAKENEQRKMPKKPRKKKGITKKDIDNHIIENAGLKTEFGMKQEESNE